MHLLLITFGQNYLHTSLMVDLCQDIDVSTPETPFSERGCQIPFVH